MAKPKKIDVDKVQKCYYCNRTIDKLDDLVIKKIPMATKAGVRQYNRKFHVDCMLDYNKKSKDETILKSENDDWNLVYQYFRKEFLGLSDSTPLQQHEIKRLLGLRLGQYYPSGNNTRILPRGYEFKTILVTMKVVKHKIQGYLASTNFANHKHRIDGIMRFISGEINDVQKRLDMQASCNEKLGKDVVKEKFDYKSRIKKSKREESGAIEGIEALFGSDDL
ncbi:hypothetical protein [Bacillus pumilus]|uniref:hypothetical protein n=1 Tax=Bacillus pumilus TaxID=1408 RepID=UPI0011A6A1E0|nr:hypothetical protein [Bacillus pumilus]